MSDLGYRGSTPTTQIILAAYLQHPTELFLYITSRSNGTIGLTKFRASLMNQIWLTLNLCKNPDYSPYEVRCRTSDAGGIYWRARSSGNYLHEAYCSSRRMASSARPPKQL